MGRLSHLGSKRNSDVLLVVQDGAPAWKTSPASGVMLSVRYQAHSSASQWYAVSRLSSLEELESRSATHLRTNGRRDSRKVGFGMKTISFRPCRDVRFRGENGKHVLVLSFSQFDPQQTLGLVCSLNQEDRSASAPNAPISVLGR